MSLVLLSQCLKAVPASAFSAYLDYLNGGERPSQSLLTTYSHHCHTPTVQVHYTRESGLAKLSGYSFGELVPAVEAETEASRYFRRAEGSSFTIASERWDNHEDCGNPFNEYIVYSDIRADYPYGLLNTRHGYTVGWLRREWRSYEDKPGEYICVEQDMDFTRHDEADLYPISVYLRPNSTIYGSDTATHTTRQCYFHDSAFTLTLSEEYTETQALADTSMSASWGTVFMYPGLNLLADGTFDLATVAQDRGIGSIWQTRAGKVSSFSYASSEFTLSASGLLLGATYKVTLLIARREAIHSREEGYWTGDWAMHNSPSYTFTATAANHDVITTPYALDPVQGWEYSLLWAGIERVIP